MTRHRSTFAADRMLIRRGGTALAAYLALHPGQSHEAVDEALWPGTRVALATRNTAMTKLRNWLGTDGEGTDYAPRATSDGYRLHPAIRTDRQIFQELLPSGPAGANTANLVTALRPVINPSRA